LKSELLVCDKFLPAKKKDIMGQLHKHFMDEHVKVVLQSYEQGMIARAELEGILHIDKTFFFTLLIKVCKDPGSFSISNDREAPGRLSAEVERAISEELLQEKSLREDPQLLISGRNSKTLWDRLKIRASPSLQRPSLSTIEGGLLHSSP
jgi:hypothetical protein